MTKFEKLIRSGSFLILFLFVVGGQLPPVYAVSERDALIIDIEEDVDKINSRVKDIKKTQDEILKNQLEIMEMLKQLKIWVRRS